MKYDISVKNSNNIEVFRGQNFTEELTKLALERYAQYPNVSIWKTPETKEEKQMMFENSSLNITNDELAMICADFLINYCENNNCKNCIFSRNEICMINGIPYCWILKAGEKTNERN